MKKLIFVLMCFVLTLSLFGCAMLKGDAGEKGDAGKTSYDIAVENGFTGTVEEWLNSLKGSDGIGIAGITVDHDGYVYVTLSNGEVYTIKVEDYCYHENTTKIVTSPTCVDRGYTTETCNDCGFVITNNYVEMIGHHFVDKKCNTCGADEKFGYITVNTEWYSTNNSTFTIDTREELAGLAYLVSEGNNFSGKTITLTNDIDLGGDEWIPIGNAKTQFAGTFDGHEYTVSNLKISEQNEYVGLFGYVTGTVKRLNVVAASINIDGAGSYAGIACGYCTGNLDVISTAGFITATDTSYVGGVCGMFNFGGTRTYSTFKNSAEIVGRDYVGGIFGYLNDAISDYYNNYTLTLNDLQNTASITGKDYVGGLFGYFYTNNYDRYSVTITASDLTNSGSITGSLYVGGISGYLYSDTVGSTFTNATSSAAITAEAIVGGIIGKAENLYLRDSSNAGSSLTVEGYILENGSYHAFSGGYVGTGSCSFYNCHNTVDIPYSSRGFYIGGIVGYTSGTLENSSNTAKISAPDSCYVGGLAGRIETSGNRSFVSCTNGGEITGLENVGGFAGYFSDAISDYYNNYTLTITDIENTAAINGTNYVGGLFGNLYANNYDRYSVAITASDLTNSGNVTGSLYVGGISGYVYTDTAASVIQYTVSSADVTAESLVGAVIGKMDNLSLKSVSNEGSTLTVTGYIVENGSYHVFAGGYVGYALGSSAMIDCHNSLDIFYDSKGNYIGGLAGCFYGYVQDVSNKGTINAPNSSLVGGIAGELHSNGNYTNSNCKNEGEVIGVDYVGGIAGSANDLISDYYNNYTLTLLTIANTANIQGNNYVGGIFGNLNVNNYDRYSVIITANDIANSGNVTGKTIVGGLFGCVYSDTNASALANGTNTGTVTAEEESGDIVGKNTNLQIPEAV